MTPTAHSTRGAIGHWPGWRSPRPRNCSASRAPSWFRSMFAMSSPPSGLGRSRGRRRAGRRGGTRTRGAVRPLGAGGRQVLVAWPLDVDHQVELDHLLGGLALAQAGGLDLDQVGPLQPWRDPGQVAQQLGDPLLRLRVAVDGDLLALLLEALQVDAG